ncbi:MAG TPA: prepilin-type N-terminal cleavage/methylation domain-containing protein [Verrucomicrobiae bacterium]|nr:prepilin-type N-terminal cleavage/methylation domain-containing protein [Verrucomicrobiae bacterium]
MSGWKVMTKNLDAVGDGLAAFTLTELLVVVAIIGILAALILTAISRSKEKVQLTECAHNVRQLGLALQEFVTDNHRYPLFVNPAYSKDHSSENKTAWLMALEAILYKGDPVHGPAIRYGKGVWRCPAAPRLGDDLSQFACYGYNAYGLSPEKNLRSLGLGGEFMWGKGPNKGMAPAVKDSEVINPSEMMSLGDGFVGGSDVVLDNRWLLWRTYGLKDPSGKTKRSYARHQGKANVAFCDGHVEALTLKSLLVDTNDAALSRWDRDHKPHREDLMP